MTKKKYIKCPLNYVGGKTKLLPQILPFFPKEIDTFYDIFLGGGNVLCNVEANKYVGIEKNPYVCGLLNMCNNISVEELDSKILEYYKEYNLSKENREGFLQIRDSYNNDKGNFIKLFTVISNAFNNQIRFNRKGEYNMPFGKNRSSYNDNMRNNLYNFFTFIKTHNVDILNESFEKVLELELNKGSFIYADPPYYISTATYNENNGWGEEDELKLYETLDKINDLEVKFALSNVVNHNGQENAILSNWMRKYNVNYLDFNYANSSYHKKDKSKDTMEILVTNY